MTPKCGATAGGTRRNDGAREARTEGVEEISTLVPSSADRDRKIGRRRTDDGCFPIKIAGQRKPPARKGRQFAARFLRWLSERWQCIEEEFGGKIGATSVRPVRQS